jgi:uncharacterized membrane-anchored protein
LAVPAKMIWDKENVLKSGKEFKFETAPVDPTDPFRGKYIALNYKENTYSSDNSSTWKEGDNIYVILKTNAEGFAVIDRVSKDKPAGDSDFVKAKIQSISGLRSNKITLAYPFDRFYMEESKAYEAEQVYNNTQRSSEEPTYALVHIKNGQAVLNDVVIGGVSIVEKVKESRSEN